MADGTITFKTDLDNADLEKNMKRAEQRVESLKNKIQGESDKQPFIEKELERAGREAENASIKVDKLREELERLESTPATDPEEFIATSARIEQVKSELAEAEKEEQKMLAAHVKVEEKWRDSQEAVKIYNDQLEQAKARQAELGAEYARTYSEASRSSSAALTSVEARFEKFGKRINTMMKKVFVFSMAMKAMKALKEALSTAMAENERYTASWANLKAVVQGIASFVAQFVAPVLTGFVNMVAAMLTTLARAIDSVFKTNIGESIERARAAAQATKDQAKATKGLAKETKKATQQLMAFDEINAMSADTSNDAADSIDDDGGASPDWNALDVGKIDEKLAEIMAIVGAALLAVGAVLAFSGINIPLGLTLMAIGALMLYTAYTEQWGKLPQEVRNAISTALVLTGIVLLVIGAVLAFSGNIPLGIGVMLAGIALLYTAAALNWNDLPGEVKAVINVIMIALSAALLVIGIILALSSPAHVALGVGLIAAGALGLAGAAALNWNEMSDEVKGIVLLIGGILSGALIVVGVILAFSGNIPLGIGLMAAGAVGMAGVAAISWDQLPADIRNTISIIMAALGLALLVIGAILVFSNVSMPVGIALMLAGAASLAVAAAVNWDAICANIDSVIAIVAAALGGALLVIGAVLAFSMANVPLGIALIAAGAVTLATDAALNWDKLSEDIQGVVTVIAGIVGIALLVLGAILTFSAAHVALGIALIAVGAATLVTVTALNWNTMPESIQNTVSAIAAIAGAALLVLGIILIATAINAPLGIALIAVGAAGLVSAAALNWDFLKQKVSEIWGGITSFWRQNIAPVFTFSWWKDRFVSIVNGLIYCINSALSDFGWFLNCLTSGISWVLGCFGVSWSGSITMPQIPYLAEGAVIPPNRKFLAVLGDQTRGNNIEAPESLMRQVVREEAGSVVTELMQSVGAVGGGQQQGDVTLVLRVDGEELARASARGEASLMRRGQLKPGISFT